MIHIALVPGAGGKLQPRVLTLRQILDQYIGCLLSTSRCV